jgi:predicted lipoprotein with Yx(FWY)xxD motif
MSWRTVSGTLLWPALALTVTLAPVVGAQENATPTVAARDDAALGSILVDPSGWTLYTFAADGPAVSACADQCAAVWPPLGVDGDLVPPADLPGTLSAFQRDDGTMQAAYNLAPLYYYSGDVQPGDANGQGVGGRWFAAPSGLTPAAPAAPVVQPTAPPPPTSAPAAAPTARPTPPTDSAQPTAAPAPTSRPAPTPVPYYPPGMRY